MVIIRKGEETPTPKKIIHAQPCLLSPHPFLRFFGLLLWPFKGPQLIHNYQLTQQLLFFPFESFFFFVIFNIIVMAREIRIPVDGLVWFGPYISNLMDRVYSLRALGKYFTYQAPIRPLSSRLEDMFVSFTTMKYKACIMKIINTWSSYMYIYFFLYVKITFLLNILVPCIYYHVIRIWFPFI